MLSRRMLQGSLGRAVGAGLGCALWLQEGQCAHVSMWTGQGRKTPLPETWRLQGSPITLMGGSVGV